MYYHIVKSFKFMESNFRGYCKNKCIFVDMYIPELPAVVSTYIYSDKYSWNVLFLHENY